MRFVFSGVDVQKAYQGQITREPTEQYRKQESILAQEYKAAQAEQGHKRAIILESIL